MDDSGSGTSGTSGKLGWLESDQAGGYRDTHVRGAPPPGSSWSDGSLSPLYNMGLRGVDENKHFGVNVVSLIRERDQLLTDPVPCGIGLDKLRLAAGLGVCAGRLDFESFPMVFMGGLESWSRRRGRNVGCRESWNWQGWAKFGGDHPVMVRAVDVGGCYDLLFEFNPANLTGRQLVWLRDAWEAITNRPISDAFVDRYDVAVDYAIHRALLALDDRSSRSADMIGMRPWGPETERTGYRKGSKLKVQLYAKTIEQLVKGVDLGFDCSRFEFQVWPESELRLGWLPSVAWPDDRVSIRRFAWDPGTIQDPLMGLACAAVKGAGFARSRGNLRDLVSAARLSQFDECVMPQVYPSPRQVFELWWGRCVSHVLTSLAGVGDGITETAAHLSQDVRPSRHRG